MASSNGSAGVVQAVRQHVAGLTAASFTAKYGPTATLAQVARACGYPGNKASQLRALHARNIGASTAQQGITRYPPLTYAQWCKLLNVAERIAHTGTSSAQAGKLAQQGAAVWRAARGGGKQAKGQAQQRKAKGQAQQRKASTEATAQAPEATAQAS